MHRSLGPSFVVIGLVTAGSLVLGSCSAEAEPAFSASAAPASAAPAEPAQDTAKETEGSSTGAEQRFGASLEQTGDAIVQTLEGATDYAVDGDTLTVSFSDGQAEGMDGTMDCLSVGGLMGDGETLVLSYPDGDVEC